jgi:tRNA (guanine-N7-)-methyltransferase
VAKRKLQQFADMDRYKHVFHAPYEVVKDKDFKMKSKWRNFFGNNNPIIVELGCGKGEYTVGLAKQNPGKNYIGVDIKGARMWRGATTVEEEGIKNAAFLRSRIDFITKLFGQNEIDEIWITFPDPQREKRRKRLTSPMFLNRYKQILKPGGIINLKTDSRLMYHYTREVIKTNNLEIITDTDDLYNSEIAADNILNIKTFYEQMFLKEGKAINYLKFKINQIEIKDTPLSETEIKALTNGIL